MLGPSPCLLLQVEGPGRWHPISPAPSGLCPLPSATLARFQPHGGPWPPSALRVPLSTWSNRWTRATLEQEAISHLPGDPLGESHPWLGDAEGSPNQGCVIKGKPYKTQNATSTWGSCASLLPRETHKVREPALTPQRPQWDVSSWGHRARAAWPLQQRRCPQQHQGQAQSTTAKAAASPSRGSRLRSKHA